MSINVLLYKIYANLQGKKGRKFKHSVETAKKFLSEFPEPENDIQRSYFQYKCQKWDSMTFLEVLLSNLTAAFLFLPKYIEYRMNKTETAKHYDAVLTLKILENKIPESFKGSYTIQDFNGGKLTNEDSKYVWEYIRSHPFAFYFNYKIMCRIAAYSESISRYSPDIIFSSAEYSFTSSILTEYCEKSGVKHINIMHGEKTYNIREGFSRFTRFYIWDTYYEKLFNSLRANKTEYVIQQMKIPCVDLKHKDKTCTYYLQLHTKEQLYNIKKILDDTKLNYMVRPHPRYSNGDEESVFGTEHIEKQDVNIWESIANAGIAISQDSTVLYQAFLAGVKIVIDDVSNLQYYNELKERGYIMLNKPHILLSDFIAKKCEKEQYT